jgi:hypothetical protein
MPPVLLLLLLGGGVAYALAAGRSRDYALSDDCEVLLVEDLSPTEFQGYVEKLDKVLRKALDGDGVLRLRVTSLPVAGSIVEEVEACQLALVEAGMSESEARSRCRVDGDTIYVPVDPESAAEIAMYVFQETASPKCNTITFGGEMLPAGAEMEDIAPDTVVLWPTLAAECYYRRLLVGTKLALLAETGNAVWAVTEEDLAAAGQACPSAKWGGGGRPTRPLGVLGTPGQPSGNPEATSLDLGSMARDLNRGALGSEAVISGVVFR